MKILIFFFEKMKIRGKCLFFFQVVLLRNENQNFKKIFTFIYILINTNYDSGCLATFVILSSLIKSLLVIFNNRSTSDDFNLSIYPTTPKDTANICSGSLNISLFTITGTFFGANFQ